MKIAFCGFGRAGKECLLQLFLGNRNNQEVFVFTCRDKRNNDFLEFLDAFNVDYTTESINNSINVLEKFNPDCLVSVYYPYKVEEKVLASVNYLAMNLHPSLLPDYKGCFSSVWAILNGEEETGITFHEMTNIVDSGKIIMQKKIMIQKTDTAYVLYNKLISLFILNFNEAFEKFCSKDSRKEQNPKKRSRYYKREIPFDGILDSKYTTFDYAEKFVRATYFPPFPPAKFLIDGEQIEINNYKELLQYKSRFKKSL